MVILGLGPVKKSDQKISARTGAKTVEKIHIWRHAVRRVQKAEFIPVFDTWTTPPWFWKISLLLWYRG